MRLTTTNSGISWVTCDCPFRGVCSDDGVKCGSCVNNPKWSYYVPVESPTPCIISPRYSPPPHAISHTTQFDGYAKG